MKLNIKNMKSTRLFGAFCCAMLFLTSCNSEQIIDENDMQTESGLKLDISRSAFIDTTAPESRVTNEDLNTTFSEGDVIGVLVTHNGENLNLPYKYENGEWTFDSSKGKDFFIKTQAGELKYVIYYPYSELADGKTTKAELLEALPVKEDQSIEENYVASDVLYAEYSTGGTSISAQLRHARALFSYVNKAKLQTILKEEIEYNLPDMNIRFYDNNDNELKMYKTSQGEYRYIVPAGAKGNSISWIYNYEGKLYGDVKDLSQTQENNKYSRIESVNLGVYDESKAQVGDFYCCSSDNKGYLLPKGYDIASSSHKCIGIVFHIGVGNGDSQNDYSGTEIASNGIKGYVMALNDAQEASGIWGPRTFVSGIESSETYVYSYVGYKNSSIVKGLQAYTDAEVGNSMKGDTYWAFKAAIEYSVNAPMETSGWYLPSIGQLTDISKIADLEKILAAAGGKGFKTDLKPNDYGAFGGYWSSSEMKESDAWYFCFKDKTQKSWSKSQDYAAPSYVRAVLTF